MLEDENEMIRSAFIDASECLSNEDVKDKRLRLRLKFVGILSMPKQCHGRVCEF